MIFMTKLKTSLGIVATSFAMMWQHKIFLLMPLFRLLVIIGLIGTGFFFCFPLIICTTMFATYLGLPEGAHKVVAISLALLIFYALSVLLFYFSNLIAMVVTHITFDVLEGREINSFAAVNNSFARSPVVLRWAAVEGVVLMLMSVIRGDQKKAGAFARNVFSSILEASWQVATFFIIPVFCFENLNVKSSLKRSLKVTKDKFGESVVALTAFGVIGGIVILGTCFFGFSIMRIGPPTRVNSILLFGLIGIGLFMLFLLTTAKTIFAAAVYAFAQGKPTGPFSTSAIKANIVRK